MTRGILTLLSVVLALAAPARPPNIVFVMCDDLGHGDLGCYGQAKIRTPNLDRLAAAGMKFTQHYAGSPVCAPSRCVLLTGKHPGHAFIRDNKEVGDWYSGEGQFPIPAAERTIATVLKSAGYETGAFGKWGLGGVGTSGDPLRHGFDRFFGFNDQRPAHNYYPQYLVDDDKRLPLPGNASVVTKEGLSLEAGADPNDPASYARFIGGQYAPDLCCERALAFIRDHRAKPFFLYFPTTVPHLALQVPEDSLAEYRGRMDDKPYVGGNGYLPHQHPRAAYAAMVTRMDRDVGRLVALVRELGLDEDTLFVFTSDNGAVYPLSGFDPVYFKSNGDLRGYKGDIFEGGLRVPLLVAWKGRIAPGTTSARVTGFEDWMPTLLELCGVTDVPAGVDGVSFAPTLLGREQPPRAFLYREFRGYGGQQMVRAGDWKALRRDLLPKKGAPATVRTELYNLADDPAETKDVAAAHPEVLAKLETIMREQHAPSAVFPLPALDRP